MKLNTKIGLSIAVSMLPLAIASGISLASPTPHTLVNLSGLILSAIAGVGLTLWLTRNASPSAELMQAMHAIGQGDFSKRLPQNVSSDWRPLVVAVNDSLNTMAKHASETQIQVTRISQTAEHIHGALSETYASEPSAQAFSAPWMRSAV